MAKTPVFLYMATFSSRDDAQAAYRHVKELHSAGVIGTYDAAVVSKDDQGRIRIQKDEVPTQRGAWTGLVVGALVGLLFPPIILADAAFALFGAGAGALVAHIRSGMSRADAKTLAALIDNSEAAVVVVGRSLLGDVIDAEHVRAKRQWEGRLPVDPRELDDAIASAAEAMRSAGG